MSPFWTTTSAAFMTPPATNATKLIVSPSEVVILVINFEWPMPLVIVFESR